MGYSLPIQNISNSGREIYLFCRQDDGSLKIFKDDTFNFFYYEPDPNGNDVSTTGVKLKKILVNNPKDIKSSASIQSWESDIKPTSRYLVNQIDEILPSNPRVLLQDIEVQCKDLPRPKETQQLKDPITTIRTYDTGLKEYKNFFIKNYKSEFDMLEDYCKYVYDTKPDIWSSWNTDFDFYCLYYRFPDFCKKISPINQTRWVRGIDYPSGISIVDMLELDRKLTLNKRDSYALNNVAFEELGYEKWDDDNDFMDIEMSNLKCEQDIKKTVQLMEKNKYFQFFDVIRRFAKCEWEQLPGEFRDYEWHSNNSRMWDNMFAQRAKELNQILPNKHQPTPQEQHKYKHDVNYKKDGAYRDTFYKGLFTGKKVKLDLGCYSSDTQILTNQGWKYYNEIQVGDGAMSFDINNNKLSFQPILHINIQEVNNEVMYNFKNLYTDQLLTWNHKVLFKNTTKQYDCGHNIPYTWRITHARNFKASHNILPLTADYNNTNTDYEMSDALIKIHAWIITEGWKIQQSLNSSVSYSISQSRTKNNEFCKEINQSFVELKWDVKEKTRHRKEKLESEWHLGVDYSSDIELEENYKIIPMWMLNKFSNRQLKILFDTLMKGDGNKDGHAYNAIDKEARDRFQFLCVLLGISATVSTRKEVYLKKLKYTSTNNMLNGSQRGFKKVKYTGVVWCPTVSTGFVLVRRNGKMFISGNSAYPISCIDFNLDSSNIIEHEQLPDIFPSQNEVAFAINNKTWKTEPWGQYLIKNKIVAIPVYFRETQEELESNKNYKDNFPTDWKPLRGVYYFKQNPNNVMRRSFEAPLNWKKQLKKKMKESTENVDSIELEYAACKSVVNCFVPNTQIVTELGLKSIEDIQVGDKVYNVNPITNEVEIDEVVDTQKYDYDDTVYTYKSKQVELTVTKEHKFLVQDWHFEGRNSFQTIHSLYNNQQKGRYNIPRVKPLITTDDDKYFSLLETLQKYNGKIFIKPKSYQGRKWRKPEPNFEFYNTYQLKSYGWQVAEAKNINIEQVVKLHEGGWQVFCHVSNRTKVSPVLFDKSKFCQFIGWFLSEGSIYKSKRKTYKTATRGEHYRIEISQYKDINQRNFNDIDNLIAELGFYSNNQTSKYGISFCSEVLYLYLRDNCYNNYNTTEITKSREKKIPDFLFKSSLERRVLFYTALYKGDGNKRNLRYNTSSKYLRDDLVRFVVGLGYNGSHWTVDGECNRLIYSNQARNIFKHHIKAQKYKGKVYCCTTKKNHTVFAGTNNHISLTGQSGFGISGDIYVRMFNLKVFNSITFLVRDLIAYIKNKLKEVGINILFIDTDSFVLDTDNTEIVHQLNRWIKEWSYEKYNVNSTVEFDLEGYFESIYLGSKCRYIGRLRSTNGKLKDEIKGLQLKRKDSSVVIKDTQKVVLNYLLDGKDDIFIFDYLTKEINNFQKNDILNIAFPCKLNKPIDTYKSKPPYITALEETQKIIPKYKKGIGDKYYWLYTTDTRLLAFDHNNTNHVKNIDWTEMIKRNYFNWMVPICCGLGWAEQLLRLAEKYGIVLETTFRNNLFEDLDNKDELKVKFSTKAIKERIKT